MKARTLLQDITFGEDVADFDEQLDQYFVETSNFNDVISDRVDLVLGVKGSGKSAIFRQLANPQASIDEIADVDIIPAFNPQGSVIFRRLADYPGLTEEALRFVWLTYLTALVANHLVNSYQQTADLGKLSNLLHTADLLVGSPGPAGVWA